MILSLEGELSIRGQHHDTPRRGRQDPVGEFSTTQQMWAHIKKLYEQSYGIFQELTLVHQSKCSIQEFYSFMETRWGHYPP